MNKIKKIFMSISIFFTNLISKVYAIAIDSSDLMHIQTAYGIKLKEPSVGERILSFGKVAFPIILFIVGVFVAVSKKITKKVKFIVISILVLTGIIGIFVMNYLVNNF